jgi:hypothetical protein
VKPDGAGVYVVDDVVSAGMTGKLSVDVGGAKSEAALQPVSGGWSAARMALTLELRTRCAL